MGVVRWGVIGTGRIGRTKVIPAIQRGPNAVVDAIASRDPARAAAAAEVLGIPKVYESYDALLADPAIDAVYITLPNHLHVPWSIAAIEAGKHVLSEKPIGLDANDALRLQAAAERAPRLKVMEAFMYRHHPQWVTTKDLIVEGRIGAVRAIHTVFSYYNVDPDDLCNQKDLGGGGLLDVGCYAVSAARFVFEAEPTRVMAVADVDPVFRTDTSLSAVMEFPNGRSFFTCSTQLAPFQRVVILGTEGRIDLELPFSSMGSEPRTIALQEGPVARRIEIAACDQYQIQADRFSRAVLDEAPVPTPLADAVANMRVIDRLFQSAALGTWT